MAVPEEIKAYIATNYGSGGVITEETGDNLGLGCMTNTLPTPLPDGYTKNDVCSEEALMWAYDNVGWSQPGAPPSDIATIFINSNPTGAKIYIDGEYKSDLTPANKEYEVAPGSHTLKLVLTGYNDWEETINLGANDKYNETITLLPLEAIWQVEFVEGVLSGMIIVPECVIPPSVMLGRQETFKIKVKNTGIDAQFTVTLEFSGPGFYSVDSEWYSVTSGSSKLIPIYFTAPKSAPLGTYTITAMLFAAE